jgi:hypothetical protein
MWALYKIYQTIEIARRDKVRQSRPPVETLQPVTRAVAQNAAWKVPSAWRLGTGLRFRRSRLGQVQDITQRDRAAAGRAAGGGVGRRSGDIEKGVLGRLG